MKNMGNQIVGITIEEIFKWQDKLESNVSEAYQLFDDFLNEAECHLEISQETIEELRNITKEKSLSLESIDDLFND